MFFNGYKLQILINYKIYPYFLIPQFIFIAFNLYIILDKNLI